MTIRKTGFLGLLLIAWLLTALSALAQTTPQSPTGLTLDQLMTGAQSITDNDKIYIELGGHAPGSWITLGTLKAFLQITSKPTLTSVSVTPASFAAGSNATSTVGTLSAAATSGTPSPVFALATAGGCTGADNAKFTISGSTLSVGASDITTPNPYSICVRATDPNFGNSPFFWPITVTATAAPPSATINSVAVSPANFTAVAGNANATVGALSTIVSSGSFAGTYALATSGGCTGTNNSSFAITGSTLKLNTSDVTVAQAYTICVRATDINFSNSPFFQALTITGIAPVTINSVSASPASFTAQSGNANSTVGTLSTIVSSGSFAGVYALATSGGCTGTNNASFAITGSTLKINTSDVTVAQAYTICVRATDTNFSNSPFFQALTITGTAGTPPSTINSVSVSPASFTAKAGNANTSVGTLSTIVSTGSFSGTYALATSGGCTGTNNASFAITGSTLRINTSDVTAVQSYTICVRATDTNFGNSPFFQALTITGIAPVTINSVSVSPASFTAQAGNANSTVGTLSTVVSAGSFAGAYALAASGGCTGTDNPSFTISGSTLKINTSDVTFVRSYTLCVRATDINFSNSPFFQALTVVGNSGGGNQITSVSLSPSSFISQEGNATSAVGTLSAAVTAGSFSGTFTLVTSAGCTSTDNSKFTISGANLNVGATDILNGGTYTVCVRAADGAFTNSPKDQSLTVTATGPSLSGPAFAAPGAPITVMVTGGPGNATDWVQIVVAGDNSNNFLDWKYLANDAQNAPSTGVTSGTVHLTAPAAGSYEIRFLPNDVYSPTLATIPLSTSTAPLINSVAVSPATFVAQAGNATSTVGTLTTSVTSGSFAGTYTLATSIPDSCPGPDNGKFSIAGASLKIGSSDVTTAGPYAICVRAADITFSNSPKFQALTVTGTAVAPPATITSVSVAPSSFVAQAGNANATVGILSTAVSAGSFSGTYALSTTGGCSGFGDDNGNFVITGSNLKLHGTDVTGVRAYAVCVTASDTNFSNSPFPQALTVNGIAVGTALTTVSFKNDSGSTMAAGTPVSLGQGFRYGDIMPGTHPLIRDASTHTALAGQQWNEISTWRENGGNGSWRHAVWSAWLPSSLASGATAQFEFISASGAYAETSHQPLTALCSGPAAHDLKIHLTDIRNVNDTVRDSGDATFRVCDNIANTGRDAPRHLDAGNVMDEYVVSGLFTYATSGHKDPLLYAQCNIDLFTKASDGTSAGDVRWVCHVHNSWMNVSAGSTGNTGNIGPAGFANDPQFVSYRAEVDDGSTDVLDWSGLDATITNSSATVLTTGSGPWQTSCHNGYGDCLFIPSSTGLNAWYDGQATRVTCSGGCLGGLTSGQLLHIFPGSSSTIGFSETRYVNLLQGPHTDTNVLNGSLGSGTTSFSARVPHAHFKTWETLDATGLSNWSPFGSASRVTRKVYPVLTLGEKQYWERTGLIIPLNLTQSGANNLTDFSLGLSNLYSPLGYMNMIGTGGPGARSDIGISNEYSARAFVSQVEADWDNARTASYCAARDGYATTLDEATGRIPALNNGPPTGPGGNGNGGSYTGLSIANQTAIPPGPLKGLADPSGKLNPGGLDISNGVVYTGIDHIPGFAGFTYMIFGDRHFLDLIQWRANADAMQVRPGPESDPGSGGSRDNTARFTDGNIYHYWGLLTNVYQTRGSAWALRDAAYGAAFGADDYSLASTFSNNPERTYFNDLITENGDFWPLFLNYRDGPGSVGFTGSLLPPSTVTPFDETFIKAHMQAVGYIMTTFLHAPMADFISMPDAKIYEGTLGSQMYGHMSSYYAIDYLSEPFIHDGDHNDVGNAMGGAYGPFVNGVDASDFGSYDFYISIISGGQLQLDGGYTITNGDTIKNVPGFSDGYTRIDQLPGNRWFTFTNVDDTNKTFFLQCTAADHTAFPAQCPVAGQNFTGFTVGGVLQQNVGGQDFNWYAKERFLFDPGPGGGYANNNYIPYAQQAIFGLNDLGYAVTNAIADIDSRAPGNTNPDTPQYNWDKTVVVAGLPAVVTHTHQFNTTLACGASPGTIVDTMGLTQGATSGGWTIFQASDPTHYAISGNNLVTAGTLPCDASQMVQVKSAAGGPGGRPVLGEMHLHVNAGGGGGPTINTISLTPSTFVAMTGNAGHTVGTLFAAVSSGTFNTTGFSFSTTGDCSGLGADNGLFTITSPTLKIGADITAAGDKHICVRATDASFTNSPQSQAFTVTGTTGPSLAVNGGSTVTAGNPVSITLTNGLGFQRDWINIVPTGAPANAVGTWSYLNGSQTPPACTSQVNCPTSATVSLTAPAAGAYDIRYQENDGTTIGATTSLTVTPATVTNALGPLAVLGSNTRLFKTPDGKGIYLTGFHTWTDFVSIASNGPSSFTQFADYVSSRKENLVRLWSGIGLLTAFNGDNAQAASPIAFNRSGTCCAVDGGNKFDLTSFNATFFNQLKSDVEYAGSKGMYVMVQMLYQYGGGVGFNELVFNGANNINGTTTNESTAYSGGDSTTVSLVNAYLHHLEDTLGSEPNVIYEVSNEPSTASFTYENSIIVGVHSYESSHSYGPHPIGADMPSSSFGSSSGDFVIDQDFNVTPGVFSIGKPVLIDTDHTFGIGGGTDWWWTVFMNGMHPLSMDDMHGTGVAGNYDLGNAGFYVVEAENRAAIEQQRTLTGMVDMTAVVPHSDLASTGSALVDTAGHQYIVYNGHGGDITVDLSSASGSSLTASWLNLSTGLFSSTTTLTGGSGSQAFANPFNPTPATLLILPNGSVGPPVISSTSLSPNIFTAVAPNANNIIGTLSTQVSAGSFGGNYTKTTGVNCPGADNNSFTLSGTSNATVSIAGTSLTVARNYDLCVAATDTNFSNSPKLQQLTIAGNSGGGCSNGPVLATNKSTYAANEAITVTASCGTGNTLDYINTLPYQGDSPIGNGGNGIGYWSYLTGATPATNVSPLRAPNIKVDRDVRFELVWYLNNGFVRAATSPPFTVTKAISPAAPVATLPSGEAADPFVPDHVVTVCPGGGCNYTHPGDAIDAVQTAGWDNVKINVSAGEYLVDQNRGMPNISTHHMWIRGLSPDGGTTRAHLYGGTGNSSSIIGEDFIFSAAGSPSLTIDNLEIGPWDYWSAGIRDYRTVTFRNDYFHDAIQGLIGSNVVGYTVNFWNTVFERHGGANGPEHNVYIGEGDHSGTMIVDAKNSVFASANYGHAFKQRSQHSTQTCNMYIQNIDDVYNGSAAQDNMDGQQQITNGLFVGGGGAEAGWINQGGWDLYRYGVEAYEPPAFFPFATSTVTFTGTTFVSDRTEYTNFFTNLIPMTSPVTWTNNKWVWPNSGAGHSPGPGVTCTGNIATQPDNTQTNDATGVINSWHQGCSSNITVDSAHVYTSLGAAGLSAISGSYPHNWRDFLPWMPAACTDPIGPVHVPAS